MKTNIIVGIDEAGRGPIAGPVVAGAVILPEGFSHPEITDSKKLSEKALKLCENQFKKIEKFRCIIFAEG